MWNLAPYTIGFAPGTDGEHVLRLAHEIMGEHWRAAPSVRDAIVGDEPDERDAIVLGFAIFQKFGGPVRVYAGTPAQASELAYFGSV